MKIENITSVHNYFMLHITCSTKIQTTQCSSVPDMPIVGARGVRKGHGGSLVARPTLEPPASGGSWRGDVVLAVGS